MMEKRSPAPVEAGNGAGSKVDDTATTQNSLSIAALQTTPGPTSGP